MGLSSAGEQHALKRRSEPADPPRMSLGAIIALVAAGAALFLFMRSGDERVAMPSTASAAGAPLSIESAIHSGRKIEAIKLYRAEHGVGLKEAKEAVEAIERALPAQ
jgi:ribosomal protein L7/L12